MQSISIIGIGRLGGALALALSKAGYRIDQLVFHSERPLRDLISGIEPIPDLIAFGELAEIRSDIVFITSADTEIASIAGDIGPKLKNSPFVFHASGSLSSDILSSTGAYGGRIGSMHPLVSISDPVRGSEQFAGAYFCVEGSDDAVSCAETMVSSLRGKSFTIETKFKPLYHASAVMVSGHLVALADMATEMLSACGIGEEQAKNILLPLIRSTVSNLEKQGNEKALTGPFARGDAAAFDRHLTALDRTASSHTRQVYLELGLRSLQIAAKRRGTEGSAEMVKTIKLALATRK